MSVRIRPATVDFGERRAGPAAQLGQRQVRVPEPQLGDLAQPDVEVREVERGDRIRAARALRRPAGPGSRGRSWSPGWRARACRR